MGNHGGLVLTASVNGIPGSSMKSWTLLLPVNKVFTSLLQLHLLHAHANCCLAFFGWMWIQSAICVPQDGIFLPKGATVNIRGYAIAGGGRAIDRVDVSVNSGHSWKSAERRQVSFSVPRIPCPCCGAVPHKVEIFDVFEADGDTAQLFDPQLLKWAWVLWKCVAQVYPRTEIIVKAIDSAGNVQPHEIDQIWNFRGVNNSCWNRVKVELSKAGEEKGNVCHCQCHKTFSGAAGVPQF